MAKRPSFLPLRQFVVERRPSHLRERQLDLLHLLAASLSEVASTRRAVLMEKNRLARLRRVLVAPPPLLVRGNTWPWAAPFSGWTSRVRWPPPRLLKLLRMLETWEAPSLLHPRMLSCGISFLSSCIESFWEDTDALMMECYFSALSLSPCHSSLYLPDIYYCSYLCCFVTGACLVLLASSSWASFVR